MRLNWRDDARAEFKEAANYYEGQDDGLGDRFIAHIQATVAKILTNPLMPRCFDGNWRRMKADKFPYVVIYYVDGDLVQIISVMHTSRRPGYWKDRL